MGIGLIFLRKKSAKIYIREWVNIDIGYNKLKQLVQPLSTSFPGVERPLAETYSYCSWCMNICDEPSSPTNCSRCHRFQNGGQNCDFLKKTTKAWFQQTKIAEFSTKGLLFVLGELCLDICKTCQRHDMGILCISFAQTVLCQIELTTLLTSFSS